MFIAQSVHSNSIVIWFQSCHWADCQLLSQALAFCSSLNVSKMQEKIFKMVPSWISYYMKGGRKYWQKLLIRKNHPLSIGKVVECIGIDKDSAWQILHKNINIRKMCTKELLSCEGKNLVICELVLWNSYIIKDNF